MSLQLEIVSDHREFFGDNAVHVFDASGGTIGRSLKNNWILPDADRYISGRHATIDYQGGAYFLADTSTNGVYVNDEAEPIGKGHPRRLFNGDRLRMGDFEFVVTIDEGEDLEIPEDPPPSVVPDHIEQLVDEVPTKTGVALLDEEEITGDDEFRSVLFSDDDAGGQKESPPAAPEPKAPPPPETPAAAAPAGAAVTDSDLLDAFLDGVGVSRSELHPSVDMTAVMRNAGQVLREFVTGIAGLLTSRATLKNAFRLNQTTVLPRHNNPLKLSANANASLMQLLVGGSGEYLGGKDAVREVCRDLLYHQDAFLDAMNHAFVEFADRFDPEELEAGFERTLKRKPPLKVMTQLKYWQLYTELYPIMTEKGGGRFPQMFAEEFVKAYERQIADFKRMERSSTDVLKTVVAFDEAENDPDDKTPGAAKVAS